MTYKVVPEVATDEMKQAAIWACDYRIGGDAAENAFRPENLEDKCPIQAAIAAAPDTGMIAVDKVKFEALLNKLECDRFQFFHDKNHGAQALVAGYIQSLNELKEG